MIDEDPHQPGAGRRQLHASLPLFGGMKIWDANPKIVEVLRERGALLVRDDHAQLHALLAPQDAGHLPRHLAVVRRHGHRARRAAARPCARLALAGIEATQFYPAWGKARCTA
jgi:isoleucyl-tRNA synthetase